MVSFPALDFHLGETIDMLRRSVQQFAQAEIMPRAAEIDRSNRFPPDLWRKMGDLGLLGITVRTPLTVAVVNRVTLYTSRPPASRPDMEPPTR